MPDASRTNIVANLTQDWDVPDIFKPLPDYGRTQLGGSILFGFECMVCFSRFRQDYRSVRQFDSSVKALLTWAQEHRHESAVAAVENAERARVLAEVNAGNRSVRNATALLGCCDEDVQMAIWGEVRQ